MEFAIGGLDFMGDNDGVSDGEGDGEGGGGGGGGGDGEGVHDSLERIMKVLNESEKIQSVRQVTEKHQSFDGRDGTA